MKRTPVSPAILLAALVPLIFAASGSAQVYPCATYGAGCRDPIPDPSSEGYSAPLVSTITVPAGVCSAANPIGSIGISFRVLHADIRDLGTIAVTSPTGVSIPLASTPSGRGGEDFDYTLPCGTSVVAGPGWLDLVPVSAGTTVYSTAVSGASSASGTWTMQLLDTRHGAYGALDDWTLEVSCGIPGVTLTTVNPTSIEGYGAPALITVSRSPVSSLPVRIYLTVAGTATSGADYAPITLPIELCGGVASRDLSFAAILDAVAEGSETLTLSVAGNAGYAGTGTTAATLTLLDQVVPTFTSPAAATFTIGAPNTFNVTVTAVPAAVLAWSGALPAGVTVTLNGDGTATIAGTAAVGTTGVYPLTFTASRPIPPDVIQAFVLTVSQTAQTITFTQPPDIVFGTAVAPLQATASSALPVAFTSQTPTVCSVTGTTVTLLAPGTCTIAADQAGDGAIAAAPTVTRSFAVLPWTTISGPTSTGSGTGTASFSGGGPTCTFAVGSFETPPAPPPEGVEFPHGGFGFTASGCAPGSTLSFTVVHPAVLPPETILLRFATGSWTPMPATLTGATLGFDIVAAADGTASGHLAAAAPAAAAIPTLGFWMMVLLAVGLAIAGTVLTKP
jgi:hypothetical protein